MRLGSVTKEERSVGTMNVDCDNTVGQRTEERKQKSRETQILP